MKVKFKNVEKTVNEVFHLTINQSYVVYGLSYSEKGQVRFLLVNDSNTYPDFFPSEFFEVIDNRISRYWVGYPQEAYSPSFVLINVFVSFEEARRAFFFDRLLNDEKDAAQKFNTMRKKMDFEFPDITLKTALILEKSWIVCAYCEEVWESSSEDGIVTCPKKHANNNPLWYR